jgi:hypothetical protein
LRKISEERTRKEMIDPSINSGQRPQLEKAGWYLRNYSKVKIEILPAPMLFSGWMDMMPNRGMG